VKEYNSQKVFVVGEVNKPGLYPVTKENNLLYILSQAGGPTKDAGDEVVIIRPKNPGKSGISLKEAEQRKETILRVNLKNTLSGDPAHNSLIKDGDSIVVPRMPFFFVMGEVRNPGKYNLERGLTVLMGISVGGGLTYKAAPNRTKIVREVEGKKVELKATMETPVQAGDTIIVPESYF
jgi:polysaccharide export outer membrane protein